MGLFHRVCRTIDSIRWPDHSIQLILGFVQAKLNESRQKKTRKCENDGYGVNKRAQTNAQQQQLPKQTQKYNEPSLKSVASFGETFTKAST